jgi:hypothetical protein
MVHRTIPVTYHQGVGGSVGSSVGKSVAVDVGTRVSVGMVVFVSVGEGVRVGVNVQVGVSVDVKVGGGVRVAVGIGVPAGNEKNPALSKSSVKFETQPYSNSRKRESGCRGAIIYQVFSSFLALKRRQSSPFNGFGKYPYDFPGPVRTRVVKSVLTQSSTLRTDSLVEDGVIVISGVGV